MARRMVFCCQELLTPIQQFLNIVVNMSGVRLEERDLHIFKFRIFDPIGKWRAKIFGRNNSIKI